MLHNNVKNVKKCIQNGPICIHLSDLLCTLKWGKPPHFTPICGEPALFYPHNWGKVGGTFVLGLFVNVYNNRTVHVQIHTI
jgi:hypothetical protein